MQNLQPLTNSCKRLCGKLLEEYRHFGGYPYDNKHSRPVAIPITNYCLLNRQWELYLYSIEGKSSLLFYSIVRYKGINANLMGNSSRSGIFFQIFLDNRLFRGISGVLNGNVHDCD